MLFILRHLKLLCKQVYIETKQFFLKKSTFEFVLGYGSYSSYPAYFFGKRVSNICGLQEHKIFSLVAHVGMEVTSSLENNLRYMEVCDIFSIYLSPMVAIIVFSKPT